MPSVPFCTLFQLLNSPERSGRALLSPAHALARAAGIVARVVRVALLVLLELLRGECDVPRGLELLRDVLRRRGLREARGGRARRLGLPRGVLRSAGASAKETFSFAVIFARDAAGGGWW